MNLTAWLSGLNLISDEFSIRLSLTLLHFLWQGCLIGGVAILLSRLLWRQSANVRYSVNVVALLAMAAALPLTFVLVTADSGAENIAETNIENSPPAVGQPIGQITNHQPLIPIQRPVTDNTKPETIESANGLASRGNEMSASWIASWANSISFVYAVGVLVMLLRLAHSIWGGLAWRAKATLADDPQVLAMAQRQTIKIGLRRTPLIAYSRHVAIPLVMGIVKPIVLLPPAMLVGLAPHQLEALLAHELAHLRRFDLIVNLLQRIVEATLFFHPSVWLISRIISRERERAADDLVLRAGWQKAKYADALVRMAELAMLGKHGFELPSATALTAQGSGPSDLKRRVLRLLDLEDRPRVVFTRTGCIAMAMIVFAAFSPLLVRAWERRGQNAKPPARVGPTQLPNASDGLAPGREPKTRIATDPPATGKKPRTKPETKPGTKPEKKTAPAKRRRRKEDAQHGQAANAAPRLADRSLAGAVRAANLYAQTHPVSKTQRPLTEQQIIAAVAAMKKSKWLTVEEFRRIKSIATTRQLPVGAKLRQFVRYDDGTAMQHGWWVRLMQTRKDRGPYSLSIRNHTVFRRPYTQKERRYRVATVRRGGWLLLGRLVTFFRSDPKFGKSPKQTADYKALVKATKRAVANKNMLGLLKLFHTKGMKAADKKWLRSELKQLLSRRLTAEKIQFVPRKYTGDLYQWEGFLIYGSNLPVEGYIRFVFSDQLPNAPKKLHLEVGAVGGQPRFVCHVLTKDDLTPRIGKPIPGRVSASGFTVALEGGWYERGSSIRADKIPELREANREIWRVR